MDNARDRAIHFTDTVDYAEEIGAKLVETSSKTGEGIGKCLKVTRSVCKIELQVYPKCVLL